MWTVDSDDSFDGFEPQDVDDADRKGPIERTFWRWLGPFWGDNDLNMKGISL